MEVQTRSEETGLLMHSSISLAFTKAKEDSTIWKISWTAQDGSKVELVKHILGTHKLANPCWVYEPIILPV
jgi:hypothetical protein